MVVPSARTYRLAVKIFGDSKQARADIALLEKQIGTLNKGVRKHTGEMARAFALGVTGGAAAFTYESIKSFSDFNDAMTQSTAIMGNVAPKLRKQLESVAIAMSKQSTFSAAELAKAYYGLASAGLSAHQSIKALPVVTKFAQAGMMDLATATDYVVNSQAALGLAVKDPTQNMKNMQRVTDVLTTANNNATGSVEEFADALQNRAAGAMRMAHKPIEEGVAVLEAFAQQGVRGAVAGQQLAIVMRDLQTRAVKKDSAKAMERFGVSVFDAGGKMRNMSSIIGSLEKALDGLSDKQKKSALLQMGFSDRSVGALVTLLGTSKQIAQYEKQNYAASGSTAAVAEKQLKSFKAQMTLLWHEVQAVAINFGAYLAPRILEFIKFVQTASQKGGELRPLIDGIKTGFHEAVAGAIAFGSAFMDAFTGSQAQKGKDGAKQNAKALGDFAKNAGNLVGQLTPLATVLGTVARVASRHLTTTLLVVGAYMTWAKASTGLKVALAAMRLLGITTLVTSFVEAVAAAGSITEVWTAAQMALDAAMLANPVGLVVAGVLALTAVIVGAIVYYKQITDLSWQWKAALVVLTGPLGLLVLGVAELTKGLHTFGGATGLFKAAGLEIEKVLLNIALKALQAFDWIPGLGGKMKRAEASIRQSLLDVQGSLDSINPTQAEKAASALYAAWKKAMDGAQARAKTFQQYMDAWQPHPKTLKLTLTAQATNFAQSAVPKAFTLGLMGMAVGGFVTGPGTTTSDTAALVRLSNREAVIPAASADANHGLISYMIDNPGVKIPGYAAGKKTPAPKKKAPVKKAAPAYNPGSAADGAVAAPHTTGGPNPTAIIQMIRNSVAAHGGDPMGPVAAALIATAINESGLKWNSQRDFVGGRPTSFGIFQFHEGGALGSHSKEWAWKPQNEIDNRVGLFMRHAKDHNPNWGAIAAGIQNPKNHGAYASAVNTLLKTSKPWHSGSVDATASGDAAWNKFATGVKGRIHSTTASFGLKGKKPPVSFWTGEAAKVQAYLNANKGKIGPTAHAAATALLASIATHIPKAKVDAKGTIDQAFQDMQTQYALDESTLGLAFDQADPAAGPNDPAGQVYALMQEEHQQDTTERAGYQALLAKAGSAPIEVRTAIQNAIAGTYSSAAGFKSQIDQLMNPGGSGGSDSGGSGSGDSSSSGGSGSSDGSSTDGATPPSFAEIFRSFQRFSPDEFAVNSQLKTGVTADQLAGQGIAAPSDASQPIVINQHFTGEPDAYAASQSVAWGVATATNRVGAS